MKTRLTRAIDELREAANGRPFVLVVEKAHKAAPRTNTRLYTSNLAPWQILGLLRDGQIKIEQWLANPGEPPSDAGEDCAP